MDTTRFICLAAICAAAISLGGASRAPHHSYAERIAPNDNVHRAGHLAKGVLTVALEARNGEWSPEESDGPSYQVAAFSEMGGALQTPGPLLRAPVGTEVRVTVHNALAVPMQVYGLGENRGFADSTEVAAALRARCTFVQRPLGSSITPRERHPLRCSPGSRMIPSSTAQS